MIYGLMIKQYQMKTFLNNSSQRLFEMMHQDDDPIWYRASGSMWCPLCGMQYRDHPYFDEHTMHGHPVDHRLCNGTVVHL